MNPCDAGSPSPEATCSWVGVNNSVSTSQLNQCANLNKNACTANSQCTRTSNGVSLKLEKIFCTDGQ